METKKRVGGIPYDSPRAIAYRELWAVAATKAGHDKPDTTAIWAEVDRREAEAAELGERQAAWDKAHGGN